MEQRTSWEYERLTAHEDATGAALAVEGRYYVGHFVSGDRSPRTASARLQALADRWNACRDAHAEVTRVSPHSETERRVAEILRRAIYGDEGR